MGYWNSTVMGGDTPQDIEGALLVNACGIDYDAYVDLPITDFRGTLNDHTSDMVTYIEDNFTANPGDDDEKNIAYQVLGVLLMRAGSDFHSGTRDLVIAAAENDAWANEGYSYRIKHMADLAEAVREYNAGHPTDV